MAEGSSLLNLTFSLLILCLRKTLASSENTGETAVLDVGSSIQMTQQVLSFDQESKHTQEDDKHSTKTKPFSALGSFSVLVHPRSALVKSQHKNYSSLTQARLARDSARVNSINAKLHFKLNNLTHNDFRPVETVVLGPEDLRSPLTSGESEGSGEYFSRVGVGQPAKPFYMVIDTGSDINWLQCEPCSDCYEQTDPVFNPASSSSYKPISCREPQCSALDVSACRVDTCLYQVSYGDGSFTVGDLATETVSFGNSGSVPNVAIGCGHDNEGLFIGAAGLLGLGGGSLSLPSQMKASSFSYCLVDRDSTSASTLEFNSAPPSDSIFATLSRNSKVDTFFYVGCTGLSVGGQMLSIPQSIFEVDQSGRGGIIVDSGTAVTRLQSQAYSTLRDAFVKLTQHLPSATGFALFDTCYDLSGMTRVSVPTVAFQFGSGKTLSLHPKNYLVPVDSSGKFCFAFAPTQDSLSIIGNIQQQGTRVSYDLANKLVGFSSNKC